MRLLPTFYYAICEQKSGFVPTPHFEAGQHAFSTLSPRFARLVLLAVSMLPGLDSYLHLHLIMLLMSSSFLPSSSDSLSSHQKSLKQTLFAVCKPWIASLLLLHIVWPNPSVFLLGSVLCSIGITVAYVAVTSSSGNASLSYSLKPSSAASLGSARGGNSSLN